MSSFSFQLVVRYKFLASLGGFAHSISIIGILNQPLKLQGTNMINLYQQDGEGSRLDRDRIA